MRERPRPVLGAAASAAVVLDALERGEPAVVLVLVHDGPGGEGRRMVIRESGSLGSLGDSDVDGAALELGARALAGTAAEDVEGMHTLTIGGRSVGIYLEMHVPSPELVIVGAGHIARPLSSAAALLGFRVTVLDDRPEFATRERFPDAESVRRVDFSDPLADQAIHGGSHVVLVTRGHRYDFECLRRLLVRETLPPYIGMIGSRRRVRATFEQLAREGIPSERLRQVRAPVGLDLGARSPAEIAVSIAAEIVLLWRGGSGAPLRDVERVVERFLEER